MTAQPKVKTPYAEAASAVQDVLQKIQSKYHFTWEECARIAVTAIAASDREQLMLRSALAMAIAEGDDGWRNANIDCPMLDAVYRLRMNYQMQCDAYKPTISEVDKMLAASPDKEKIAKLSKALEAFQTAKARLASDDFDCDQDTRQLFDFASSLTRAALAEVGRRELWISPDGEVCRQLHAGADRLAYGDYIVSEGRVNRVARSDEGQIVPSLVGTYHYRPAVPTSENIGITNPQYLGDGVYVHRDEIDRLVLTTGHHEPGQAENVIVLESFVAVGLVSYIERMAEGSAK